MPAQPLAVNFSAQMFRQGEAPEELVGCIRRTCERRQGRRLYFPGGRLAQLWKYDR